MFSSAQKNFLIVLCITVLTGCYFFWLAASQKNFNSGVLQRYVEQLQQYTDNPVEILGEASVSADLSGKQAAIVTRVVDGDTIDVEIDGQPQTIRYIGVNTPETKDPRKGVECYGKESYNENKRLVEGQTVYLEKDVSETDRYGRLLRFVYLPLADGNVLFVNDYLVRAGFAQVSTYPPDVRLAEAFGQAETVARERGLGLWSACNQSP